MQDNRRFVIRVPKTEKIINDLIQYIICICILFNGNAVWKYLANGPTASGRLPYTILTYVLAVICIVYSLVRTFFTDTIVRKRFVEGIFLIIAYNLFYIAMSRYGVTGFLAEFLLPLISFTIFVSVLMRNNELESFFVKLSNVIFILAVLSLAAYFLGAIMHVIPEDRVVLLRNGHRYTIRSYFGLTYIGQEGMFLGQDVLKNTGIYLEAPGWALPLTLGIFVELFIKEKRSLFRILVIIFTAITAFSTKAFITVPLLLVADFMRDKNYRDKALAKIKVVIAPLLILAFIMGAVYLIQLKSTDSVISFTQRGEDTVAALNVWKNYLLLGCGFGNLSAFEVYLTYQSESSIASGMLKMFAQCGLFIGIEVLFLASYICRKKYEADRYKWACLLLVYVIYLLVSSTWTNTTLIFMISIGCATLCGSNQEPKEEEKWTN